MAVYEAASGFPCEEDVQDEDGGRPCQGHRACQAGSQTVRGPAKEGGRGQIIYVIPLEIAIGMFVEGEVGLERLLEAAGGEGSGADEGPDVLVVFAEI